MTRTETRRMIELEDARDRVIAACERTGSRAALDAWHAVHGAELDYLHDEEQAEISTMRGQLGALLIGA